MCQEGGPAELTAAYYLAVIPHGTGDYFPEIVQYNAQGAVTDKRIPRNLVRNPSCTNVVTKGNMRS